MIQRSAAVTAAAWVAPAIIRLDTAGASAGSITCPAVYCFASGTTEGWTIDNSPPGVPASADDGLWKIDSSRSTVGGFSLHYGNGTGGNYATGSRNAGIATSPTITMPAAGSPQMSFDIWRDVESYPSGNWDRFEVRIQPANDVLYFRRRDGGTSNLWESPTIDLSAYVNDTVTFEFSFDTGDGLFNNFEGVYVDNISLPCDLPPIAGAAPLAAARADEPREWAEPTSAEKVERGNTYADLLSEPRGVTWVELPSEDPAE